MVLFTTRLTAGTIQLSEIFGKACTSDYILLADWGM